MLRVFADIDDKRAGPVTDRVTPGPRGRLDAGLNWLWRRPIKSMGLGQDTQGLVGQSGGVVPVCIQECVCGRGEGRDLM